jgi:hypothetical protein
VPPLEAGGLPAHDVCMDRDPSRHAPVPTPTSPPPGGWGGNARFTYLHGGENLLDEHERDDDLPGPAQLVRQALPDDLARRIRSWDERMGHAFDYARSGEGRPPSTWPASLRTSLTEEYESLLAEMQALGLPVVRDAWW